MKVLLVTTGRNRVRECLAGLDSVTLGVMDVIEFGQDGKGPFLEHLRVETAGFVPDMIVVWRCPYIIPPDIYSVPGSGAYNLHPSLLPKYPGLNPWDEVYGNNETVTGVTLHRITDVPDGGEIIHQCGFSIVAMTREEAREKADCLAARMIEAFIKKRSGN